MEETRMRRRATKVLGATCVALALGVSTPALADGDPGCGLGSMLWEGQSGIGFNLFASTTNGSFGTQTIGISFGTSGCTRGRVVAMEHRLEMFVGMNADRLARDMALGEGESLEMLASLMGVAEAERPAFCRMTQEEFTTIFPSRDVSARDVLSALRGAMVERPELAGDVRG
jgi:hypothetical protein